MGTTKEPTGRAMTKRGRERLALQAIVTNGGADADDLKYVEDKRSGTAKVVDKSGEVKGRFCW